MELKLDGKDKCVERQWPLPVQATYWAWLHGLRRGLAPLRVQLAARRVRASSPTSTSTTMPIPDPSVSLRATRYPIIPPPRSPLFPLAKCASGNRGSRSEPLGFHVAQGGGARSAVDGLHEVSGRRPSVPPC